jgi:hypothetical protein
MTETNALFWIVLVALLLTQFILPATENSEKAIKALQKFGFTEIKIKSHNYGLIAFRGCSRDDTSRFDVRAKNSKGDLVDVSVCTSWFSGSATVRSH